MADYKSIKGTTIQNFTADPDNIIEGQVWYDETARTLQYEIPNLTSAGAWRTGNAMNTARRQGAGAGIQLVGLESSPIAGSASRERQPSCSCGSSWRRC